MHFLALNNTNTIHIEGWAWRLDLWRCCSVLFGAVRCCSVLFGAAARRLDLGSKDVSVKARELLLNESGNRRTRTIRLRNRLTLAKQGPVTLAKQGQSQGHRTRGCFEALRSESLMHAVEKAHDQNCFDTTDGAVRTQHRQRTQPPLTRVGRVAATNLPQWAAATVS